LKPDILSRKDIKLIITTFYEKLLGDEKMRPFFEAIVQQNQLEHHLEIITDFWNDILFDTSTYHDNVMQKHLAKNTFIAFQQEHFTRWVSYFFSTIDALFEGDTSTKMKIRAQSIATVMQLKMNIYDTK
jgi:hemoglobin